MYIVIGDLPPDLQVCDLVLRVIFRENRESQDTPERIEGNETLHRLLDRALLCGASILGPELAIAILTEILYTYNCRRRSEKRNWNAKVTPVIPIQGLASLRQYENTGVNPLTASHLKVQDEPVELDGVWTATKNGHNDAKDADTT